MTMFGKKRELESRIAALESDVRHVSSRYWELSNKYGLLLDYLELREVQPSSRPVLLKREQRP